MNQYGPDILILNSNSREKCLPFFTHTHNTKKKLKEQNGNEAHGVRLGPAGLTDKGSTGHTIENQEHRFKQSKVAYIN